jgi:hypothetical protein
MINVEYHRLSPARFAPALAFLGGFWFAHGCVHGHFLFRHLFHHVLHIVLPSALMFAFPARRSIGNACRAGFAVPFFAELVILTPILYHLTRHGLPQQFARNPVTHCPSKACAQPCNQQP